MIVHAVLHISSCTLDAIHPGPAATGNAAGVVEQEGNRKRAQCGGPGDHKSKNGPRIANRTFNGCFLFGLFFCKGEQPGYKIVKLFRFDKLAEILRHNAILIALNNVCPRYEDRLANIFFC